MNWFLDSSVLIPVFLAEHPHHAASIQLFRRCTPDTACCASHSLAEVYSTLTRLPLPHRAKPMQAIACLEAIQSRCTPVSLSGDSYLSAIRDAAMRHVVGGTIYDALLARTARCKWALSRFTPGMSGIFSSLVMPSASV